MSNLFKNNPGARVRDFVRKPKNMGKHTTYPEAKLKDSLRPDLKKYAVAFRETDLDNFIVAASSTTVSGTTMPRVERSSGSDRDPTYGDRNDSHERTIRMVTDDQPTKGRKRKWSPIRSDRNDRHHDDYDNSDRHRGHGKYYDTGKRDGSSRGRTSDRQSPNRYRDDRDRSDGNRHRGSRRDDKYYRDLRPMLEARRSERQSPSPTRYTFSVRQRTRDEEREYSASDKRHRGSMRSRH